MSSSASNFVVGVDMGGTKILAAVVDPEGRILGRNKRRTVPRNAKAPGPALIANRIAKAVRSATGDAGLHMSQIQAVGASAPGPIDVTSGRVYGAVNLPNWEGHYDLGPELHTRLRLPVYVDNDVNLGTLGEATYGSARGIADVIGIFVGTGIGGGVILDGHLRRGFRWAAGEIGHMMMHCNGSNADVESFASRGAISKRLRQAVDEGQSPILTEILEERGDERITSSVIRKGLERNDAITRQVLEESEIILGELIASVVNLLDPMAIVLGGGLVESLGDSYVERVRVIAYDHFFMQDARESIRIVPAELGDDAVVLGAAVLARQKGIAGS